MKIFTAGKGNAFGIEDRPFGENWNLRINWKDSKVTGEEFVNAMLISHDRKWAGGIKGPDITVKYWLRELRSIKELRKMNDPQNYQYWFVAMHFKEFGKRNLGKSSVGYLLKGPGEGEIKRQLDAVVKDIVEITGDDISGYKEYKFFVDTLLEQHKKVMSLEK